MLANKLIEMGFHNGGKGLRYLIDAIEIKMANPTINVIELYIEIQNKYSLKSWRQAEASIRYCIQNSDNTYAEETVGMVILMLSLLFTGTKGILVDNVRIYKCDDLNYTFDIFGEQRNFKTKESKLGWKKSNKYYHTLEECLDAVSKAFINETINLSIYTPKEFCKRINQLKKELKDLRNEMEVK